MPIRDGRASMWVFSWESILLRGRKALTERSKWSLLMSKAGRQLLKSFDSLPDADKHQVALTILRQFLPAEQGGLPESALLDAAEQLFKALDAEETSHAQG